jgi:hypothetical protein
LDDTAPTISGLLPIASASNVSLTSNISFSLNDDSAGVAPYSINCVVSGVNAIVNGIIQPAFDGVSASIAANANNGYDIVLDPTSSFSGGHTIAVSVSANDNCENPMTSSYSFTTINDVLRTYTWDYSWWSSDVSSTSWPARDGGQDLTFRSAAPTTGVSTSGFTSSGLPTELVNNAVQIDETSDQARTNSASIAWKGATGAHAIHIRAIMIPRGQANGTGYVGLHRYSPTNSYQMQIAPAGTVAMGLYTYWLAYGVTQSSADVEYFDPVDTPMLVDMLLISDDDTIATNGVNRWYAFINGVLHNSWYQVPIAILDTIDGMSIGTDVWGRSTTAPADWLFFGIRKEVLSSTASTLMTLRQHQLDAAALGLCTVDDPFDYDWDLQWRSDDLSGTTWASTPAGATLTRAVGGSNATTGVSTSGFADSWLDDDLEDTAVTLTTRYTTATGTSLDLSGNWTVRLIINDISEYTDGQFFFSMGTAALRVGRTTDDEILLYFFNQGTSSGTFTMPWVPSGPMLIDIAIIRMGGGTVNDSGNGLFHGEMFINGKFYASWQRTVDPASYTANQTYTMHGVFSTTSTGSTTYSAVQIRIGQAITLAEHRADAIAAGLV